MEMQDVLSILTSRSRNNLLRIGLELRKQMCVDSWTSLSRIRRTFPPWSSEAVPNRDTKLWVSDRLKFTDGLSITKFTSPLCEPEICVD